MAECSFEKLCSAEQEWKIISTFLDKLEDYDELHFRDLFSHLSIVSCTEIQKLCNSLSVSQKHNFFKNRPVYFKVQGNYISKVMSSDALKIGAHKKFCSSARYILQCFGPVHYLEIKKVITFIFEDVALYILKLPPEEEKVLMKNIRNVVTDDSGVLTLTTSRKVGTKRISPEEKCLLAIVYYLGLHGRTHFKKLFEELETFALKECDLVLGERSDSNHLTWLRKHEDYFQVHEDNFVSLYEEYSSYKCSYQKLESEQLPSPAEPICHDFESCHLSKEGQILTSTNEQNVQDNIVTSNRSICKKFYISATYLTSCFNPLHYLEVKECIFFVMEDVANVLKKLSMPRLQKLFEKVPFTTMDQDGFLIFREDCNFDTSFVTNEEMLNLFIVYYLGFCGKIHFEKVIEELVKRAPEAVSNSIVDLSTEDQLKYFKQFPKYFGVSRRGELDVNASFVLPYFEYKNDTISDSEAPSKEFSISSDKCIVIKRLSSGIAFLLTFFQLKVTLRPLRVLLHVLNDAKTYFLNLSALDQIDLIKAIFSPFSVDERGFTFFAEGQFKIEHLTKAEKEFLYFVNLISEFGRMHYRQAIEKCFKDTGKIPNNANSDSLRFRFFKEAEDLFQIGSDGFVTLHPLPRLGLTPSFFSEVIKTINPNHSANQCNKFAQVNNSVKESSSGSEKNSCKDNVHYATDPDYKKFCGAVSFLLTHFNSVHFIILRKIIPIVLTDVGMFLSSLPFEEQDKIFWSIPQTSMDENGFLHLTSSNELHSFVSKNKKQFLFIVCFLAVNGQTHFSELQSEMEKLQFPVSRLTPGSVYGFFGKYPKYFTRNASGYIKLSPSLALSSVNLQDSINFVSLGSNQNIQKQSTSLHQKFSTSIQSQNTCVNSAHLTNKSCTNNQNQSRAIEDVEIRVDNILNSNGNLKIQSRPSQPEYPIYKKIHDGISYLLQYFTLNVKSNFLQVLLLVLDDNEIFHHSSINDKIGILKQSLSAFKVSENSTILSCENFHSSCLVKKEIEELVISFIVFEQKEMHFLKIFQELHKYNLFPHEIELGTSTKFHYFKQRKDIFYIGNDGYVSVLNWPHINLSLQTILECFSSTDGINPVKSENNCLIDITKKGSLNDQSLNLLSSTNQSKSVCEDKNEKEPNNKILGVDGTSLSSSNLCLNVTEVENVDDSFSESVKDENKSDDGHVPNLNKPIINLDSSTVLKCVSSVDDINLMKSENNCQAGITKKGNQIKSSNLPSTINQLKSVYENKQDENILGVDETIVSTISTQCDKFRTSCSNVAEAKNANNILSEKKSVETESSEVVEATYKFNASNFSPSREWFSLKNDQNGKATNCNEGGIFKKVQLEKTTSLSGTYKTKKIFEIIKKDEQNECNKSENKTPVPKFDPNLFIPSKDWFSTKSELINTEACGTKLKNPKKPVNCKKPITPSSNSAEIEKVVENIENFKCVPRNSIEKVAFNSNLPASMMKLSSADSLTKETCIHKTCDQNLSSQRNVSETLAILIQSITLLLKYYDTKVNWALVSGVFQVLNDVTNKFFLLSKDDQSYVLKKIFKYFSYSDKQLNDLEISYLDKCELSKEQENLLILTYTLSCENKMDYLLLFKKIEALENNFFSCGLSDSDKYKYLMKRNNIFSIEAGLVKLHPFPHIKLKSQVFDADLKVSMDWSKQVSIQQSSIENKKEMPANNLQRSSSKTQLYPSKLNHICGYKPEFLEGYSRLCLALESQTAKLWSWPKNAPKIYGELLSCIKFLKKSDVKIDWRLVCAVFQVMSKVRSKFLHLAKDIQINMLEYIFLGLKKVQHNLAEFYLINYPLNEEQENLLILACILTNDKKLHFLKLFEKFKAVKKNVPSDMLTDSYKYFNTRDSIFYMADEFVELLPFPYLELKKRVLDVDLRVGCINNYRSWNETSINDGTKILENDLQASKTTVKLDLPNLNRLADKLTGPKTSKINKTKIPETDLQACNKTVQVDLLSLKLLADKLTAPKILSNAHQTFSSTSEFIGSRPKTFEETSVKCFSESCDTKLENKDQTLSTSQLKTLKFYSKKEKIEKSASSNEETSAIRFKGQSALTQFKFPGFDYIEDKFNNKVLESKSPTLCSATELDVFKFNKTCENTNIQLPIKSNDVVSDVTLTQMDGKANRSLSLIDFGSKSSVIKSKDTELKSILKDDAKAFIDKKLNVSGSILQTSKSTTDFDPSSSSVMKSKDTKLNTVDEVSEAEILDDEQLNDSRYNLQTSKSKADFDPSSSSVMKSRDTNLNSIVKEVNEVEALNNEKLNDPRSFLLTSKSTTDFDPLNSSVIKSKDNKLNTIIKEVINAESLNNKKLETENIPYTLNSTGDCDTSKSSDLEELSEISSANRRKKRIKNKSHNLTSVNDAKICHLEEKSRELSYEDSKETVFESKPSHDRSFVVESNVQTCNKDVYEGMEKQDELPCIENSENISGNKSQPSSSRTQLKPKKVNDERAKTDKSLLITNTKVDTKDAPQQVIPLTESKSALLNITEKQNSQSLPTNTLETVSETRSSRHETMNPHDIKSSKSKCLEEKDSVVKNIGSSQSKGIQKSSPKIKGPSKDSSPVSKECLDKLCKKIQAGIAHLLKYFRLTTENLLLKVLFHVLGSSKMFIGLPDDEKLDFLQNCFDIFELDKKNCIILSSLNNETKMLKLKHEEKVLLSVTSVLSQWKELHYRKIFQQLQNQVTIPGDKEQFNFFRKRTNLFSIANNGYVKLCNFPDIEINSAMFSSLFQAKTNIENVTSIKDVSSSTSGSATHKKKPKSSGNEALKSKVSSPTGDKMASIQAAESLIIKDSSAAKFKMPDDMCKKVKDAIYFLLNYFKLVPEPHLVCVILHALNDVRSYFANLNFSDQDNFVKESLCNFCTNPNGEIAKFFYLSLQFNLNNNDKDMLFLCCILGQVNELHYQEIFHMYAQYQRVKPASVASPLDMHKYFSERKDLFSTNADGYVKLNLHFVVAQNSKILSISSISSNSNLLRSPLLNSAVFKNGETTQQAKSFEVQLNEVGNKQVQNSDSKHSLELKRERFKESVTFLNSKCDKIASDCVEVIILHILDDLQDLDQSERERLLPLPGSDSNNYTQASSKSRLTEEEKGLLAIAHVLIQAVPVHYGKLFQLLVEQNRGTLKISTESELYQYILKQSKYFSVTSQGTVSFNSLSYKEIENYNYFGPSSEEYLEISLSKSISTENDSCSDKLIDSLIEDDSIDKNKNKPNRIQTIPKTSRKPTFNALEIIEEESSSDSASFDPTNYKAFNLTEFSNAPKTRLEQQSVYFFAALLANVKMANSLEERMYLASEDIQNHLKECYNNNINHFLEIHQMSVSSF